MKYIISFGILVYAFFITPSISEAYDAKRDNNKYGIHLSSGTEEELRMAAKLVNGTDGSWGYVTVVIQENDRDVSKWQSFLDNAAKYQLIPLIRIATQPEGSNWRAPQPHESGEWVSFFESLNWHMKYKYIILFNEPNHATEWGGNVDPEGYADVAYTFASDLNESDPDMFVMLAGFDAAAPSRPGYEDEETYIKRIFQQVSPEKWEEVIDGWASHSYPRDFVGSVTASGRRTPRTYAWELEILKKYGFTKDLPVFITETGWHNSVSDVTEKYLTAFQQIWGPDSRVVAVTPFLLTYETPPFDIFSWKKPGSDEFYPFFDAVSSLTKGEGQPLVESDYPFGFPDVPVWYTFYLPILTLANENVVNGYDDFYFRPQNPVTRAEMAKFITNAFELPRDTSCERFPDVPVSHPFSSPIHTLKCVDIISGYSDGSFLPDASVSRGEAMKFVIEAVRTQQNDDDYLRFTGSSQMFTDVDQEHPFYEVIMAASMNKIVTGYDDGTFKPAGVTDRGGMSKMVEYARSK